MKKLLFRFPTYGFSAITLLLIFYLTLVPHPVPDDVVPPIPGLDKVVHGVMFGWLTLMLCLDYWRRRHCVGAVPSGVVVSFAVASGVLGGLVELAQVAMDAGRGGDWVDWLADVVGCLLAGLSANGLLNFIGRRLRR